MLGRKKSTGAPCAALLATNSHFALFVSDCFAFLPPDSSLLFTQDFGVLENIVA
jgi:hypothetical protein